MSILIKICGITRLCDALAAAMAGADFLGFVFHERSPRNILPSEAAGILAGIRDRHSAIQAVGVVVNQPVATITRLSKETGIGLFQLHGNETPAECCSLEEVGIRVVKAFRFGLGAPPVLWQEYSTEYFLCDTFDPTAVGGTGKALDLSSLPEGFPMEKTFLAGGLNPETVAKQVQRMHPFAVDVSSGVEVSPGIKCPDRVRRFIQGVRQVQALPE